MLVIGLCGGSGSGKTTVAKEFIDFGIPCINADEVYRELLYPKSPLIEKLRRAFGDEVICVDGSLNRKALAARVFYGNGDVSDLHMLNKITHSAVIHEAKKRIEKYRKAGKLAVVFDAPLLFESKFNQKCDVIVSVIADKDIRIDRIMERDGIGREAAEGRIAAQLSDEFLKSNSDYVIVNNGTVRELSEKSLAVVKNIFKRGK